ncbi:MAG: hypothetical protein P8J32_01355 [bacterium]|jgi:hypothetical protein|nr:hypothetical protein [bacterium]
MIFCPEVVLEEEVGVIAVKELGTLRLGQGTDPDITLVIVPCHEKTAADEAVVFSLIMPVSSTST